MAHLRTPVASGISGWLLVPAAGLLLAPVLGVVDLYFTWQVLSRPTAGVDRASGLAVLAVVQASMIVFTIGVAYYFFGKQRVTRPLYVALLLANVYANFLVSCVIALHFKSGIDYQPIARSVVYAGVWIPYFLLSIRVRETFTLPIQTLEEVAEGRARRRKWLIWKIAGVTWVLPVLTAVVLWVSQPTPYRKEIPDLATVLGGSTLIGGVMVAAYLLVVWMIAVVVRYPHVGWKRLALSVSPVAALITTAITWNASGPEVAIALGGLALLAGPAVLLLARNATIQAVQWILAGFNTDEVTSGQHSHKDHE